MLPVIAGHPLDLVPGAQEHRDPLVQLARLYLEHALQTIGGGASGLLAFGVKGGLEQGVKFIEGAQFMSHLVNIGDTPTLISHPASTTHRQLDPDQQLAPGVRPDMIRISVGLEHIDDILWDVDQALASAAT